MTIPTWLCWTLGIGIGVPALIVGGIYAALAADWRNGRNPFQ